MEVNATSPAPPLPSPYSPYSIAVQLVITVCFFTGAVANVASLCILHRSKRRNVKHVLLLRCLATNDLVAQVGMLLVLNLMRYQLIPNYWSCVGLVVLRGFGLGSGTVAFVMALERWLALTRPFIYHQVVTYQTLKRMLCCLWLAAVLLTYLPLFGFGLYYDNDKRECIRFRYASTLKDKIYAYTFFIFGATLCLSIALCNIAVVCELSNMRPQNKYVLRRTVSNRANCLRYQTPEEIAFAKLMAYICVIYVVCWAPQVISVPVAQLAPENKRSKIFTKIADILLTVYFTLDPFIYVLQRYIEKDKFCCLLRQRSNGSIRTITTEAGSGTPTSIVMQPLNFPPANVEEFNDERKK